MRVVARPDAKAERFNITVPGDRKPLVLLTRDDYGSFSAFVLLCLDAYGTVRLKERRTLTALEVEEALAKAGRADAEHTIRLGESLRELHDARLEQVQEELDKLRAQAAKRPVVTVKDVLDTAWKVRNPYERENVLRDLATQHGLDAKEVRAAAEERRRAEIAATTPQANLLALPEVRS